MTQIIGTDGLAAEVNITLDDYAAAYAEGKSLPQYLNGKYETNADKYGTPFEQAMASNGMFMRSDRETGIKPPSMADVLAGRVDVGMGPITKPDGSAAQTVSGRILFPAVILQMVESELMIDNTTYEGVFNRMIATTTSVDSPRVDQPIINLTAPRGVRSQPISQLSEPAAMVSISLSEQTYRMPTYSIGLEISDEAQKAATIDLVGIALREQAIGERAAMIDEAIQKMVNGDVDSGISALSAEKFKDYDTTIAAAGVATRVAWLKWLRKDWKKMNIDWVICDLDTYLAIESAIAYTFGEASIKLNTTVQAANPGLPMEVNFFIVDTALLGANTMVGIDSKKAIRKTVYSGASYSAIEQFVLRKSSALRIDFSVAYRRLFDQAWKKITLTT